jgi:hypothetical protein
MTPRSKRPADVLAWLATEPSIDELSSAFPGEWERVRQDAARHGQVGDSELRNFVLAALKPVPTSSGRARPQQQVIQEEVRRRMLLELLRQADVAAETGIASGVVRFTRFNGTIAQRLLFEKGLRRKPASMAAYRLLWPLIRQRRLLMPLVRRQGIYCFYSRSLIKRLARLIGDRPCLEIAAGDGTLTRFLSDAGADVVATDDYSWANHVTFDDTIERLDAVKALRRYSPKVVLCSWPPPGNAFERQVFTTPSVETYVVITSVARANASDWAAYETQDDFEMLPDPGLSKLVLPVGHSQVLVFRRKPMTPPA